MGGPQSASASRKIYSCWIFSWTKKVDKIIETFGWSNVSMLQFVPSTVYICWTFTQYTYCSYETVTVLFTLVTAFIHYHIRALIFISDHLIEISAGWHGLGIISFAFQVFPPFFLVGYLFEFTLENKRDMRINLLSSSQFVTRW
jgi:hypothetical protein